MLYKTLRIKTHHILVVGPIIIMQNLIMLVRYFLFQIIDSYAILMLNCFVKPYHKIYQYTTDHTAHPWPINLPTNYRSTYLPIYLPFYQPTPQSNQPAHPHSLSRPFHQFINPKMACWCRVAHPSQPWRTRQVILLNKHFRITMPFICPNKTNLYIR